MVFSNHCNINEDQEIMNVKQKGSAFPFLYFRVSELQNAKPHESTKSMKPLFSSLLFSLITMIVNGQTLPEKITETNFSIGKTIEIKSIVLDENRTLNIYLPLSYELDSAKNYPVIYLLDGSKDEDFIHVSGIVQFGSFSWINILPESIVVGIANVDRKRDFTSPSQNKRDRKDYPTTGHSEKFIQFLESELQPFIESSFRTEGTTTIIGQSLGGLLATEILFKKPDMFNNYVIVSPSLWWNDEKLLETEPVAYEDNKSIYISVGKEGKVMERTAKELHEKLTALEKKNTRLFFEFLPNRSHGDALHTSVYHAFEGIFRSSEK